MFVHLAGVVNAGAAVGLELAGRVDKRLPAPLHYQVREVILDLMRQRGLGPGDVLPTEEALRRDLGVSRATVRQAMQALVAEGRLERTPGKGTFVARPQLHIPLSGLVSWTEEMHRRGLPHRVEVLGARAVPAPMAAALALALDEGAGVVKVRRLRWVEDEPVVLSTEYLAPWCGLDERDHFAGSLYALLAARGHEVAAGEQQIRAVAADGETARLLRMHAGGPVLFFRRTAFDATERPLVYEESACRGDMFDYTIRLRRLRGSEQGLC